MNVELEEKITLERVMAICKDKGYWFPNKRNVFDIFLFAVRADTRDQSKDAFDDIFGCIYYNKKDWHMLLGAATTDPGLGHMMKPIYPAARANGTAILTEGQHRGLWKLGYHGSGNYRHRALQQVRPVRIYRDKNKDTILDMRFSSITEGLYGINGHCASLWRDLDKIGLYSAGCQVVQSKNFWDQIMWLCEKQVKCGLGEIFSHTLLLEYDFDKLG